VSSVWAATIAQKLISKNFGDSQYLRSTTAVQSQRGGKRIESYKMSLGSMMLCDLHFYSSSQRLISQFLMPQFFLISNSPSFLGSD